MYHRLRISGNIVCWRRILLMLCWEIGCVMPEVMGQVQNCKDHFFPVDFGQCEATITGTEFTGATVISILINGNPLNGSNIDGQQLQSGHYDIKYFDSMGTLVCEFQIIVYPDFTLPANPITKPASQDACFYKVLGSEFDPVFTCSNLTIPGIFSLTQNFNGGTTLADAEIPVGTHTIIWTLSYNGQVLQTDDMTVTVIDQQRPSITCPTVVYPNGKKYFPADGDCVSEQSFPVMATTDDNCSIASVDYIITEPDNNKEDGSGDIDLFPFKVGTSTVIYTVTDVNNNENTCSFTVDVHDDTPPIPICKPVTLNLEPNLTAVLNAEDIDDGSTDNCGNISSRLIKRTGSTDDYFAPSLYFTCDDVYLQSGDEISVTLQVMDDANNPAECTALVTVIDDIDPVAICKPSINLYLDATGKATLSAEEDVDDGSTDNCEIVSYGIKRNNVSSYTSSLQFHCADLAVNKGDIPIEFQVTDASGNDDDCKATVHVIDTIKPTVSCQELSLELDAVNGWIVLTPDMLIAAPDDNCGITETVMLVDASVNELTVHKFDCNSIGEHEVTVIVRDASGNERRCTTIVTVSYYDGNIPDPKVTFTPANGEICSDGTVKITLNNDAPFDAVTTWEWDKTLPAGITEDVIDNTQPDLEYKFANSGNAAAGFDIVLTPTLYGTCSFPDKTVTVTVNPHPQLTNIADVTVCNGERIEMQVQTNTQVSASAEVFYSWTYTDNTDVTGESNSSARMSLDGTSSFNQELTNPTNGDQQVEYTLTPSLIVNEEECPSSPTEIVTVTVMPTPDVNVAADVMRVCNGAPIQFTVDNLNELQSGVWKVDLVVAPEAEDMTVTQSSNAQFPDDSFEQSITNNTLEGHTVAHIFTPRIEISSNKSCPATSKIIAIEVNPTPVMAAAFSGNDRICYSDGTNINITSTNGNLFGTLMYRLDEIDYTAGTIENTAQTGDFDLTQRVASIDQTTLENTSNTTQSVKYRFYPFIEYGAVQPCKGTSVEKTIQLAAEVKFDLEADTVYGGYNIRCHNEMNGRISIINATGGWSVAGEYDYTWSANAVTGNLAVATNLAADTYSLVMKDRLIGCDALRNITLTQPNELLLITDNLDRPDCKGPTGSIKVHAEGGAGSKRYPYRYEWVAGALFNYSGADSEFSELFPGRYTITASDINNCYYAALYDLPYTTDTDTILHIANWQKLRFGPDVNGAEYNVSCAGASSGEMNINPGKQVSAYVLTCNDHILKSDTAATGTYFSYPAGDFIFTGLSSGEYRLSVIDERGCIFVSPPEMMTEPKPVSFNPSVSTYANHYEIECIGEKNGSITINNISGGYGFYQYNWATIAGDPADVQPGTELNAQNNLGAGKYALTVHDLHCDTTMNFTLNEPPELVVSATMSDYNGSEVRCFGELSGNITLDVSGGGEGAYSYRWTTENGKGLAENMQNQSGLSAGNYTVAVGYSDGLCSAEKHYTLRSPDPMCNDSIIMPIKCFGDRDASIITNISGGVPSYTYLWTSSSAPIQTDASRQRELPPGVYLLTVTDANGCTKNETYTLIEPTPVTPNLQPEDMSCSPGNDGFITAQPYGGTPGYTFLWTTGATADVITGLSEGLYSIVVTDANNCTATSSANIRIPTDLSITAIPATDFNGYNIDCFGNQTGRIELDIQNGRGGYIYQWSNGAKTQALDNAEAGVHTVAVTDKFNCQGVASATLTQPHRLWGQLATVNMTCPHNINGNMQALVGGGITPYRYLWSNGAADRPKIDGLNAGTYSVRVVDRNNCFLEMQEMITSPPEFQMNILVTDAFCPQTADGEIRTSATGGTPPYTYKWGNTSETPSPNIHGLRADSYTVEITDAQDCHYSETIHVGYNTTECLRIPNAFSPNDDGSNDRWEITVGDPLLPVRPALRDLYPDAVVEVYASAWGIQLFRSQKGYPEPWDGRYRGKYLPVNSYVYIIRLGADNRILTGHVTIIR